MRTNSSTSRNVLPSSARSGGTVVPLRPVEPAPASLGALALAAPSEPQRPATLAPQKDRDLVARILAGSQADFDALYDTYFHRVHRFAMKRLRDAAEAEDVTQEVFETIFRVLPSWRGDSSLLVWIFGITRNKVNRRFRGARPRFESLDDAAADRLPTDSSPTDVAVDARRMLDRCDAVVSERLTPLQRRIFHLKHLRRQPIRSIAKTLGKSEDAIKANLYRMRRALADGAPGLEGLLEA